MGKFEKCVTNTEEMYVETQPAGCFSPFRMVLVTF